MTGEAPFVLALDLGTSSTRAMVFDASGRELPETKSQLAHTLRTDSDGTAEFSPQQILREVEECLDTTLRALAQPVAAVAISQFVTNLLAVDAAGAPLTPVITYADTRCAPEVDRLRALLDERAVHDRTGCRLHSSYWPAQVMRLQVNRDAVDPKTRWLSIGEWIQLQLCGGALVSRSVASWTGLLNRNSGRWDSEMLATCALDESQLSPIADDDDALAEANADCCRRWPQLAGAAWLAPVSDGAASNLGSGCLDARRVALSVGTSGAMRVVIPRAALEGVKLLPFGLACYQIDSARCLPACALNDAGSVFAFLKNALRLRGDDVEAELAFLPPLQSDVNMLPFLTGERSPGWNPRARFVLHGAAPDTSPLELLQAGMEAVTLRFVACLDELQPFVVPEAEIIASGGGLLNSPTWCQMMADALGRPVVASTETEPSARGAALLALEALGLRRLDEFTVALGAMYEPRPELTQRYRAALTRQQELYRRMFG